MQIGEIKESIKKAHLAKLKKKTSNIFSVLAQSYTCPYQSDQKLPTECLQSNFD